MPVKTKQLDCFSLRNGTSVYERGKKGYQLDSESKMIYTYTEW